jgi:hypothetical protein
LLSYLGAISRAFRSVGRGDIGLDEVCLFHFLSDRP